MSTPLLIGLICLIWLGLLAVITGMLRVGTSTPTPQPSGSFPSAMTNRPLAATWQRARPKDSLRASIATRVEAA